jgi:uncharacterized protein
LNIEKMKALRSAIKEGDVDKVGSLIREDNELLHTMTPFGSWLHVAASFGKLEIVKLLLQAGIDINCRGGTFKGGALNEAASEGHTEIAKFLVSNGAQLDVSEPEKNPLFGAIHVGNIDTVKLLLDSGIDARVKYSGTSMMDMDAKAFADERGQLEIVRLLENYGL